MATDSFSTLVVGGGIMGLSVAWGLARRGQRVTMLEQGALPNPLGSSVDAHRLIRHAYGGAVGYMRMVSEAFEMWERLWADLGVRHYAETGTLLLDSDTGDKAESWARQSAAAMAADGLQIDAISDVAARARWPMVRADFRGEVFHAPGGGVLFAERIVRGLAAWLDARAPEVAIHSGAAVAGIEPDRCRVTLADGRVFAADRLVIAAGPWGGRLVPGLARALTPSRQVTATFVPPADLAEAWAGAPMILDIGTGDAVYMVPPVKGTGLKVGRHAFSRDGDPDAPRVANAADITSIRAAAALCLGNFEQYDLSHTRVCFYSVADEERFIVRPLAPDVPDCWLLAGFSGHGFKFGTVIGDRVAAALSGELPAERVTRWAAGY